MRLTIGLKIVILLALILLITVTGVVGTSTHLFVSDNVEMIQQMNADSASHISEQMRNFFESSADKMRLLGSVILDENSKGEARRKNIQDAVNGSQDLWATFLIELGPSNSASIKGRVQSADFLKHQDKTDERTLEFLSKQEAFSIQDISRGGVAVSRVKLVDGTLALLLGIPFLKDEKEEKAFILVAVLNAERLEASFSNSQLVTNYMVDSHGALLAHSDMNHVLEGENVSQLEIVKSFLSGKMQNAQMRFMDASSHQAKLGAYRKVGFAGLGVVSEVPEEKAFEATKRVQYRSILFGFGVLCLAFLLGYLFSTSITKPINRLVDAARRISEGDFKLALPVKGKDEMARLSGAFNEMAKGLEERDRVKATFHKFHNKEIAEKLLSGEVRLGGETKDAIVLFTDLRGFTTYSEALPPEQVVEMLNEYMTIMVRVISAHGGVVDKYVGDAIMALWGVPLAKEGDLERAVRACLEMRTELAKLNVQREKRGQASLKMGMGLNIGRVVVGNIGSEERMEYTAIGDTVNLASRIESATKTLGVDLLVAKSVVDQLKNKFLVESFGKIAVKGKSQEVEVFQVHGAAANNQAVKATTKAA